MGEPRQCKDCAEELKTDPHASIKANRPAPHPGPRCVTHHRRYKAKQNKERHEKRVQRKYNLKPGEYDKLHAYQGGRCAICRRATGKTRKLSVDHDHETGLVRGLLCRPCNDMLGHLRDDPEAFMRAVDYLNYPPYLRMRNDA